MNYTTYSNGEKFRGIEFRGFCGFGCHPRNKFPMEIWKGLIREIFLKNSFKNKGGVCDISNQSHTLKNIFKKKLGTSLK